MKTIDEWWKSELPKVIRANHIYLDIAAMSMYFVKKVDGGTLTLLELPTGILWEWESKNMYLVPIHEIKLDTKLEILLNNLMAPSRYHLIALTSILSEKGLRVFKHGNMVVVAYNVADASLLVEQVCNWIEYQGTVSVIIDDYLVTMTTDDLITEYGRNVYFTN